MNKHTPGPWSFFRGLGTGNFYVESNIPGITASQQFLVKIGESESNARLIAAAPEMLKELVRLANNCECQAENGCKWCAPTLAVIRKATGL